MYHQFIQSKQQQTWLEVVKELAEQCQVRAEKTDRLGIFPKENFEALRESGYTAITVPKKYGGQGMGVYDLVLLQECLATGDGATALSIGWHLGIMYDLAEKRPWREEVFAKFCREVVAGALVNRAATERQTGSPTRGGRPQTTAVRKGDQWMITGRKIFTTMAPILDYFLVTAWIEEKETLGEFLVPRETPGVMMEETWDVISMRGTGSHDLVLREVLVPEENLVELLNKPRNKKVNPWLLHIPACYAGIAQAARHEAVAFASTYQPNSLPGPIKEVANIQRLIGEMELYLFQARHLLYSIASRVEDEKQRPHLGPELGAVKLTVTNHAITIVDLAMRVVGARSLQQSHPLQRHYRDVRSGLHNPPMDDTVMQQLAHRSFAQYEEGV